MEGCRRMEGIRQMESVEGSVGCSKCVEDGGWRRRMESSGSGGGGWRVQREHGEGKDEVVQWR